MKKFITLAFDYLFNRLAAFRVIYDDGKRTVRLRYSHAISMKANFGGKIIHDPPEFSD